MDDKPYRIPLFDLDIGEEERQAVLDVLDSKWLTMGDVTRRFEQAFSEFLSVPYCFAVCNGTAALHLAVRALEIGPGDEVICPSLTFVATSNAVLYAGATPVFADIEGKEDFNISSRSIESRISDRTKAIMVVHYGGFPCRMDEILDIATRHDLKIIEDAAHAPGAEFLWVNAKNNVPKRQKVGTIGDVGCFSFFSNKNLSTGEGGMVVTKDEDIAEKIKAMRSHGMTSLTLDRYRGHNHSYDVVELGHNYRIDEIRAAMGIVQLKKLPGMNEKRNTLASMYRDTLQEIEGLKIPFGSNRHQSAHHIFPVLLPEGLDRIAFMDTLKKQGIQTSIHYPPVHQFSYYQKLFSMEDDKLEWTDYVGRHEVTLPLYPSLREEDVDYIISCVKNATRKVVISQT